MTHYLDKRLDEAQKSLDEMLEFSIKLDGKAGRKGSRTIAAIRNRALRVRMWLDGIESHASATDEMLQRAAAIRADASELYESVRPVENQKRERRQRTTTTTTTPRGDGDLAQRVLVLEQQTDALGKIATQQAATIGLLCRRSMRPDVAGAAPVWRSSGCVRLVACDPRVRRGPRRCVQGGPECQSLNTCPLLSGCGPSGSIPI